MESVEEKELVNLEFIIQRDIIDLRDTIEPLEKISERSVAIQEKMKLFRTNLKELKQIALEQDSERDKEKVLEKVKAHEKELSNLNDLFRKATIQSKVNLNKQQAIEKEALLKGGEESKRIKEMHSKAAVMKTASDVTLRMRRTRQLINEEVQRGNATMQILESSSKTLDNVRQEYSSLTNFVRSARGLLTQIKRRELTDKLLILLGLVFFFLVVIFIFRRRMKFKVLSLVWEYVFWFN